jgi:sulfate adenylyltransferase subunit 1
MDILRFITAGSVDDGKSTLIGRLLYDSKSILTDQLAAIQKQSKNKDAGEIDLAILTDGLRAEREQGITIDVAYKYFSTLKRKFIIADAPGHAQYTRNMVTGASNADLVIILIDARKGVIEQSRRHSIISSLLGIRHVIVAINKMDLVSYDESVYNNIVSDYKKIQQLLKMEDVRFLPVSALNGENIVERSANMSWYTGEPLLHILENIEVSKDVNLTKGRFPVQYVIRPQTEDLHDYRGYAGKITSGIYKKGDAVVILPSKQVSKIKAIDKDGREIGEAFAPQSVIIRLEDDIDVSRGDLIIKDGDPLEARQEFEAMICWMDSKVMKPGSKYILQHNGKQTKCAIKEIAYKLNVNTLAEEDASDNISLNDVCKVSIKTALPLALDSYKSLKTNGGAILIDETSCVTVGACIIL